MPEGEVLTRDFARERKSMIGDVNYELFLKFRQKAETYDGKCRISFELKKKGNVVLEHIGDVKKVLVNGKEVSYDKDDFTMTLNEGLEEGENSVDVEYSAVYDNTGSGLHRFIDPEDDKEYIYSDFEPYQAHRMFPCFDQPDIKAKMKLKVEAPADWNVISNENGEEKTEGAEDGLRIVEFPETKKLSTYLFHVSLGNYDYFEDSHNGISMRIYFRNSMKKYIPKDDFFKVTKQGVDFYSDFFDYDFPFSKYDQIFAPEFNSGAMENPGAITFSERLLVRHKPTYTDRSEMANVILHEMAHMWFGDLVTMKWWDDLWLNESFADFMSYAAMVKATEFEDAWEEFYVRKEWAYYQDQLSTTHPIATSAEDTDVAFSNFDGISYSKGASVLKQLLFYIGEEDFRKGVSDYFKKYEWDNTELKDFLECLENSSGKNLKEWFDSWITTTGINSVFPDRENGNLKIVQKPSEENGIFRRHKTKVAFFADNENRLFVDSVKDVTYDGEETVLESPGNFSFAFLNYEDYDYVKDKLDEDSMEYVLKNIGRVEDDLTRHMLYGSLWQHLRDAELNPRVFLDMILENAPYERKLILLERFLMRTKSILVNYLPERYFEEYCVKIFDLAWKMLESDADYEKKDVWFSFLVFAASGAGKERAEKLVDVLEGKKEFNNLELDPDKRWSIVIVLNSLGHERADELIGSEKEIDKSDRGQKRAAVAEASKAERKDDFWNLYVSGDGKSLDYIRDAMAGFYWKHQKESLKDFPERFFNDIIDVFDKHDKYYSLAFFKRLFPMMYAGDDILEKTKKFMEEVGDSNLLLKKYLAESIDDLQRILRVLRKYGD